MLFPRRAGSWYHLSKVHDTYNVEFACRNWGLRSTDIMQGVVYGTRTPEMVSAELLTRFDFDECFGTAINRFCAQAVIGVPITPYGAGTQKRGFLPLVDSLQCLTIAIENPPQAGEYRTFNQFDRVYSINALAEAVREAMLCWTSAEVEIRSIDNPRKEAEDHSYNVVTDNLRKLGYTPKGNLDANLIEMLGDLIKWKDRIAEMQDSIRPKTRWDGTERRSEYL